MPMDGRLDEHRFVILQTTLFAVSRPISHAICSGIGAVWFDDPKLGCSYNGKLGCPGFMVFLAAV